VEGIELPGYGQIENEKQLQAIFLDLLEDCSELGSSFRAELQDIVRRNCGEEVDLSSSVRIAEKDKIDVTIECANVVLLIELKWDAEEGVGQIELYEKVARCFYRDWKKVFLFITRDGHDPVSRTWVPVTVVPSAKSWDTNVAIASAKAIVNRHTSQMLGQTTGIQKIANLLGPDFAEQICERAESLTGIPHAVCREYSISDGGLKEPRKDHSGGWYGAAPGRHLRLFERTMAETPEFYVACGDGLRLPFVMSEILVDGLELRIKYHSFANCSRSRCSVGPCRAARLPTRNRTPFSVRRSSRPRLDAHRYCCCRCAFPPRCDLDARAHALQAH
jgi:PD-(D/E)XK nuclease superfamily